MQLESDDEKSYLYCKPDFFIINKKVIFRYFGIKMVSNLFAETDDAYKFLLPNFTRKEYQGTYSCEIILPNKQKIKSNPIFIQSAEGIINSEKEFDKNNHLLFLRTRKNLPRTSR